MGPPWGVHTWSVLRGSQRWTECPREDGTGLESGVHHVSRDADGAAADVPPPPLLTCQSDASRWQCEPQPLPPPDRSPGGSQPVHGLPFPGGGHANGTPCHIQHSPNTPNHWAPRTRKRHQQEHRPQRLTESSDPTQHAKGRTGDRPGPRKETATRRNVTQGWGFENGSLGPCALTHPPHHIRKLLPREK